MNTEEKEMLKNRSNKNCQKCGGKGWYEDRASLIRFKCKCVDTEVTMKKIEHGGDTNN